MGHVFVGRLINGVHGAILGASAPETYSGLCNSLELWIIVNNVQNSLIRIIMIDHETPKDSDIYKNCINYLAEIQSLLEYIKYNR